jgi:hypothetical protein
MNMPKLIDKKLKMTAQNKAKTKNQLFRVVVIDPEHRTVEIVKTAEHGYFPRNDDDEIGLTLFRFHEDKNVKINGWLENEGTLIGREQPVYAFLIRGLPYPFLGRMCIEGEYQKKRHDVDALFSVEDLHNKIEWLGLIMPKLIWPESPIGLKMTHSKVSSIAAADGEVTTYYYHGDTRQPCTMESIANHKQEETATTKSIKGPKKGLTALRNRAKALGYRLRRRGNFFELSRLDGSAEKDGSIGTGGCPLDDLAGLLDIIEGTGALPSASDYLIPVASVNSNPTEFKYLRTRRMQKEVGRKRTRNARPLTRSKS